MCYCRDICVYLGSSPRWWSVDMGFITLSNQTNPGENSLLLVLPSSIPFDDQ